MRLLVDLQALQGDSVERGIGYYAASLTRALVRTAGDHEVHVLFDGGQQPSGLLKARGLVAPPVEHHRVVTVPAPPRGAREAVPTEVLREACIGAVQPDVVLLTSVFELAPGAPLSVNEHCSSVATAAVLHDLIPLTDLDAYKPDPVARADYLAGVDRLRRLDLLLTNSDHTGREAQRLLTNSPPVRTVRGAAADPASARRPPVAPPPGFGLAVGRHEPRKDVRTAVMAWAGLPLSVREGRHMAVVGAWDPGSRRALERDAGAAGLPSSDLHFVTADDAELRWYYENASVLLFPSLDEGLGMPPLEAAAAGTPTLLARSSSLVELTSDERVFFTPQSTGEITALLQRVLGDPTLLADVASSWATSAQGFSWDATARRAWESLESLQQRKPAVPLRLTPRVHGGDDLSRGLVKDPGAVHVREVPAFAAELLAPAIGLIVDAPSTSTALLENGLVGQPITVLDPGGGGVTDVSAAAASMLASDPLEHWLSAAVALDLPTEAAGPLLRRPLWACRPRGVLYGSDVSLYQHTGFLSGIQRTVLRLHRELDALMTTDGGGLVPLDLGVPGDGAAHPDIAADPLLTRARVDPGDVEWALCLDLDAGIASSQQELLSARAGGTRVATNVFDCLPWVHPEWWPPGAAESSFNPWLQAVLAISDVLLVNSVATAVDVERFASTHVPARSDGFAVHLLRLGSDFGSVGQQRHGPGSDAVQPRQDAHFLMVSTVEPRKGHRRVLDAVGRLWAAGQDVRLTIVGRAGWMVDDIAERMRRLHREDPRLTWHEAATDATLEELYGGCTAVVVASDGEGFGLPIVEAAARNCPVIVHDIPVLRELAGTDATYFTDDASLDRVLRGVVADPGCIGPVAKDAVVPWAAVARQLYSVLQDDAEPLCTWGRVEGWVWNT